MFEYSHLIRDLTYTAHEIAQAYASAVGATTLDRWNDLTDTQRHDAISYADGIFSARNVPVESYSCGSDIVVDLLFIRVLEHCRLWGILDWHYLTQPYNAETIDSVKIARMAQLAHEVNRIYCSLIDDTSHVAWYIAPEWQRESAIAGVTYLLHAETRSPGLCHARWLEDKRANGWTYGACKDYLKREHPCMQPFADLPIKQRVKDHLFVRVVDLFS